MGNVSAMLLSYVFVFAIIALGEILRIICRFTSEFTRKFIHIGVGHWVIPAVILMDVQWLALIPPITFVGINYLSLKKDIFKAMETDRSNYGTVLYALSLVILVLLFFRPQHLHLLVLGTLVMAWGDGLAAIIGRKWGKKAIPNLPHHKTFLGSGTMFLVSFLVSFLVLSIMAPSLPASPLLLGMAAAAVATILEAFTARGWDNLAVPLGTSIFIYFLGGM